MVQEIQSSRIVEVQWAVVSQTIDVNITESEAR